MLRDGPKTSEALATAAGAHPGALYRLLRALAGLGIFAHEDGGRFSNGPLAQYLLTDSPESLRAFVIMLGQPESWLPWGQLLHSVETGKPAFDQVFGMPQFRYLAANPEPARVFDEAMASRSAGEIEAVLESYDFSGAQCVIDIGGGTGALLAAILRRYPQVQGVLFDMPHVIDRADSDLARSGQRQRCRLECGDFFQAIPSYAGIYILKKVIHDWDDERARKILQNCRAAMQADDRLLLIELLIPPGNTPAFAKFLDLLMLVWPGGRERTEDEYREILLSARLRMARVIPTKSLVSIMEAQAI